MKTWLFFLLLAASAFATCIDNATEIIIAEQGINIGIVLMLTILLIAIAYMAGSMLGNVNYIVFAKDEAYHLLFSVVILISFSGIVVFTCHFMDLFFDSYFEESGIESSCYGPGLGMHDISTCYGRQIESDAKRLANSYIQGYIDNLMDSTFAWSFQIPLMNSLTSTADAYKRIVSNQYDIILNSFLVPAVMSISMQRLGLEFITENVVRWILPTGFLLRVIIPTRQMGNIIIALAIGLYVLVPFMFVFNLSMYEGAFTTEDCEYFAPALCDNVVDGGCDPPESTCENPDSFWNVARLLPQAFFLPNLTLAILITFLASIHKALRVIG
ncbi:hypothetical protein KKB44_03370 [Candidatus Micrarchaeota archaeon]|nr:hypothetical protein [Candidatus Micrarchaeota archaeon]